MEGINKKENKVSYKNEGEIIQKKISSLEKELEETKKELEPLYDVWEKFMRNFNAVKNGIRLLRTRKDMEAGKIKIKEIENERDTNPDFIKMNLLEDKKNKIFDDLSKLNLEQYENSLNEFNSEILNLSDDAYKELDFLTKEHIEPMEKYGLKYEMAKKNLDSAIQYKFERVEHRINVLERIQNSIKEYLEDKSSTHDIERLRKQLKEIQYI
ncbi:hypothetical protein KKG19_04505 [Patescibacteria group bacterium]|nr:hypothetical protein [Patescibacteria group bacterium]